MGKGPLGILKQIFFLSIALFKACCLSLPLLSMGACGDDIVWAGGMLR